MSSVRTAWPRGIDVSNWQNGIDWEEVAAAGYTFAGIKATEGTYYRDPYFARNWSEAGRLGFVRMAYHFAQADDGEPEAEADWFLQMITDRGPLLPGDLLALDLEVGSGDLSSWTARFATAIDQRVSFPPLLYSNAAFLEEHGVARPEFGRAGLWLAAWRETLPEPPAPWTSIAVWQFTDAASVPGISGTVDGNECPIGLAALEAYGAPGELAPPDPAPLPSYDWQEPSRLQENDWDCSCESMEWALYSWGRTPDDNWIEESMISEGVVSADLGCLDASGAGLAAWANRHYQSDGYVASNQTAVSFERVAEEAGAYEHPVAIGGAEWNHWSAVRGFDPVAGLLLLANPAPGYQGVGQTMNREQFAALGPFSLVRVCHPAAEGDVEEPPLDLSYWEQDGRVGSGLLDMMRADGVQPAQDYSTWLPLGRHPAQIEECVGENGVVYRWLLTTSQGYRYAPS